jgi:glycosyltransferase involved in cell wall biosynthesis
MRLLVVNFEMDRLSRTMPWSQQVVNLLAKSCEEVAVLTSRVGHYDPPANVHVEVMPFPRAMAVPVARLGVVAMANLRAFRLARRYRVEACFVHMAVRWVYYLRPCFSLLRLPVLAWYAHGTVSDELHRAHRAATRIVTSSSEGFRIPSDKVRVIGQGVDTQVFDLQPLESERNDVLAVTRISPRKQIELLIEVMQCLRDKPGAPPLRLKIIGTTITREDQYYDIELRDRVWRLGLQERIEFVGFVPQPYIPVYYRSAFLHLNLSRTGSMDKTVVEALACGCPVLTSNEAFFDVLRDYPEFIVRDECLDAIAGQILALYARRDQCDREALRALVVGRHDVHTYVRKILANLQEIRRQR